MKLVSNDGKIVIPIEDIQAIEATENTCILIKYRGDAKTSINIMHEIQHHASKFFYPAKVTVIDNDAELEILKIGDIDEQQQKRP